MFSHKDVLPSGRILVFMITLGKTFFYLSVSTFIIASLFEISRQELRHYAGKYSIQPQEDQYGNWGFRKVLVRKLHNFIYKEQYNQPRTSSQPDSRKDPWA